MTEWQLKNLPPGSKSEELLNSTIDTTEEKRQEDAL